MKNNFVEKTSQFNTDEEEKRREKESFIKRFLDFVGALFLLTIFSPLFLLIAILIKCDSKGPVFYKQARIGKDCKEFLMYKFRTMIAGAEKMGLGIETSKDDFRVTRVGRFLRAWSIDELPQLINVLKGEMSLIGPRPPLPQQLPKFRHEERRRFSVKPGITGWAQVNGRNLLTWRERVEYDLWYVDKWSILLDLRIILKTFWVILRREGLFGEDGVTRDIE